MAIRELPPINIESEKPNQLNLEQMYAERKALIDSGVPEAEIPQWEVYVRQKYRDSLDYIQRFTSDGEVQIIGTNLGKIEHSEYTAEDAFRHLDESVVRIEEPEQYRFYITDISLLRGEALRSPNQVDSLREEFNRLTKEGKVVFGPPLDEAALWQKVHGTPQVIELGAGADFDRDREAADRAEEDQKKAEADAIRLAAIEAEDHVRDLAEIEMLRAAARQADKDAEVGEERDLADVRAELADSLHAKLDKDTKAEALSGLWSTNSSGVEYRPVSIPSNLTKQGLLDYGYVMGAPEVEESALPWKDVVSDLDGVEVSTTFIKGETQTEIEAELEALSPSVEPLDIPAAEPIPGQPTIFWPALEPVEIKEGSGHEIDPEAELPEGVRKITYKTSSGKDQTRYQRADGKFVGKDGLTARERMGEEAYQAKKVAEAKKKELRDAKTAKGTNGHKNDHGKNGNGKGVHPLNETDVVAESPSANRTPERAPKGTRAPRVEARAETELRLPIRVFDYIPSEITVMRNMAEYRAIELGVVRAQLDADIRNLTSEDDLEAKEKEILKKYGVHVTIMHPQNTPVKR